MDKVLSGKIALVTGATHGLGLEIAKTYVQAGAHVMLCARDKNDLKIAQTYLKKFATPTQRVLIKAADVAVEQDVNALVHETLLKLQGCHIVVNNAGIYGPKGLIEDVEWSEWVKTIETNVYGSVLICRAILPHFKTQGYGKIIQLSGGGATQPMPRISAYAASKAAIVRFAETLAQEVRHDRIDINAIAPGPLNTRMLDEILDAGPEKVGEITYARCLEQKKSGGTSVTHAAALALFLASDASNGISGKLISAVWDDWAEWPKHRDELLSSDAYTLRRIIGKDRNITWGDR